MIKGLNINIVESKKIAIVGGGSAGYLTAAYLLNNTSYDITMIVPENDVGIGVGEATLLGFKDFMAECGLGVDAEWMYECDALYKCGILYDNWREDGKDVWHPFAQFHEDFFDNFKDRNMSYDTFIRNILPHHALLKEKLMVTPARGYHLDAKLLVKYLSKKVDTAKVGRITAKVANVEVKNGLVDHLVFEDGTTAKFDTYVDCGGFNSPFKEYGNKNFRDLSDMFVGNAACAAPVKYSEDEETRKQEMAAYTKPTGCELGWVWNTPVASRIGTGLIYNSDCNTKDEAEAQMKEIYGEDNFLADFLHIKYTPGYSLNPWRGNVCSIGLSSGFLEPLESTGIDIFQGQISTFCSFIKKGFHSQIDREMYNRAIAQRYEESVDYVMGHYNPETVWRKGPFWQEVKKRKPPISLLLRYRNYLHEGGVSGNKIDPNNMFGHQSWTTVFEGFYPNGFFSGTEEMDFNINDEDLQYCTGNHEVLDSVKKDYDEMQKQKQASLMGINEIRGHEMNHVQQNPEFYADHFEKAAAGILPGMNVLKQEKT